MTSERHDSEPDRLQALDVTHREALALLASLELSPFDDEVLEQKLLSLIYSPQISRHPSRRRHGIRDFSHHRR